MGLIFTEQTRVSSDVHPGLAFVVIWLAEIWLSMVEGGQASLVGLSPIKLNCTKTATLIPTSAGRLSLVATTFIATSWVVSSWLL